MSELFSVAALISLVSLSAMEIVLGIDNIVFISILSSRLPHRQQSKARRLGLLLALGLRLGLLMMISWIMSLTKPLFVLASHPFSARELILLGGGLFLVAKSTHEMYEKLEGGDAPGHVRKPSSLGLVLLQIALLDIVFSLDSVITAVGMARQLAIMVAAMIIAVGVMLIFANRISNFVNRHPSMKVLALSFLLLIGVVLVADGMGKHIEKGYIYFAMAFSLLVELLNMRLRKKHAPLQLHERFDERDNSTSSKEPA
jgi:predicted tellurium resistance membrane protein TerC